MSHAPSTPPPDRPPTQTTTTLQFLCRREQNTSLIGWNVDMDMVQVIPCFWTTFPLPSTFWVSVVFSLYLIISIIAIIGNGLIILLWFR